MLCDLDNTMVDRAGAFAGWALDFAASYGQDESFARWLIELDADGHRSRPEMFAAVEERLAITEPVAELIERYYGEYLSHFRPDEHVRGALEAARASGWRIAIVSNGSVTQQDKVRRAGLDGLIDACCVSAIEGFEKPDPRLLTVARATLRRIARQRLGDR
jgi:FMN phosphatase YigB (HAD superfamily)